MFFAQYSLAELASKIFGQVLLAVQRASRRRVLPVTGSSADLIGERPLEFREPARDVLAMRAARLAEADNS